MTAWGGYIVLCVIVFGLLLWAAAEFDNDDDFRL